MSVSTSCSTSRATLRWISRGILTLKVDPSAVSMRGFVERNAIALLSNLAKPPLDQASGNWRGNSCDRGKGRVRDSGIWNQNHVDEAYDPEFLNLLERLVNESGAR